jgi:enoyl-[acyl-carrier-protein] reductase (NADH)
VLFLVSEQARHITTHDLYVDGGATLRETTAKFRTFLQGIGMDNLR